MNIEELKRSLENSSEVEPINLLDGEEHWNNVFGILLEDSSDAGTSKEETVTGDLPEGQE